MFARHRREVVKKRVQRIARRQVIKQRRHRDAGSPKHQRSAENILVLTDQGFTIVQKSLRFYGLLLREPVTLL
jgi:hypothetical protein